MYRGNSSNCILENKWLLNKQAWRVRTALYVATFVTNTPTIRLFSSVLSFLSHSNLSVSAIFVAIELPIEIRAVIADYKIDYNFQLDDFDYVDSNTVDYDYDYNRLYSRFFIDLIN
jgi:hypothetical protein